jgi:6-pyruvoyltetrahydropterin/6-carboxytetrahydropterin synthase
VTRRYRFPAAHVLSSRALSDEENRRIFGKCANPSGHGHNYGVEVSVTGPVDARTGQILPVEELDAIFDASVREPFSHRLLNDVERFATVVPTAENIAVAIHEELSRALGRRGGAARVARVRLVETPRNVFDYGEIA